MTNLPGMETIIEVTYLIATALFILALVIIAPNRCSHASLGER